MHLWSDIQPFVAAVVSLFAIIDPIGGLPVFLGMTSDLPAPAQRYVFRMAVLISTVGVIVMAFAGELILHHVFHVEFGSFMIGGGVLLVVVAVRTIVVGHAGGSEDVSTGSARERLIARAASPIACPLMVGPGSIVTSMFIVRQHGPWFGLGAMIAAFLLVLAVLQGSHWLIRRLGRIGPIIVERLMMIFIAAIGVDFIYRGILTLFPRLKG